jgi:hypothetical protein
MLVNCRFTDHIFKHVFRFPISNYNPEAVKQSVSKGAKFSEGLSWSQQLADKVEPIATHISWSVRNCDENPQKLKESLILFIPKTNSLILKNIHNIVKAFHIECVFAQNIILGMLVNCRFTDHIWNRYISSFY